MKRDLTGPDLSCRPSQDKDTVPDDGLESLLGRIRAGDGDAEELLIALLYKDLRQLAARRMRRERPDHTWQPTALVHEALLRLRSDGTLEKATDRAFLLMAASKAMQQLLVDHHRRHSAEKRGGHRRKHPLDATFDRLVHVDHINPVDLRDELEALSRLDPRAAMVVHWKFFLGMSRADVAESLGISQRTVERDWDFARAWLRERLKSRDLP
jgi:RNA polymerase sigma-70 factor, ECF subfamily